MENLQDLQAQARSLERSGQHAAALELYGRIVEEPAGDRDGGIWARTARLHLALGQDTRAADAYATAVDRYAAAGLNNLALSFCQQFLRIDDSRPELLLRFGRLSARAGYARDARHGFVEFADRAAAGGDTGDAVAALREFLERFPGDAAVRRRISELTGEEEPERHGTPEAAPRAPEGALPDLIPTAHDLDTSLPGAESLPGIEPGPHAPGRDQQADELPAFEPLEGFEPTHAGEAELRQPAEPAAPEELPALSREGLDTGQEGEEESGEPLPLLEMEEEVATPRASPGTVEDLPLLDMGEVPEARPPAPAPVDPLRHARERVAADPGSLAARRDLVSLLAERGDPGLEEALRDAEHHFAEAGRTAEALEFVEQLARRRPEDTALQQRRVERALRAGDRQALVEAYLALAARLEADLDSDRAQETLQRVLELDPGNEQARAALASATAAATPPRDYIDLGELILAGAPEEVTRFQVAIGDPTGDEESDFAEILNLFRKKVSESLDPKDAASHYDLGLAFKEMGLLDDAIIHLQSGLRGGADPLATLEVLGECFVLKGQISLAARVFERATRLDGVGDSDLVGVLYGLARCQESLGQLEEARATLERVVAVDLSFRDAAQRLQRLQSR